MVAAPLVGPVSTLVGPAGTSAKAPAPAEAGHGSPSEPRARGPDRPQVAFEDNRGQTDPRVRFVARLDVGTAFFTDTGLVLDLHGAADPVRMTFEGGADEVAVQARDRLPGDSHYFVGDDGDRWATDVPRFDHIVYRDIYPGIDVVFYGNDDGHLEYDFVVAPGADPSPIEMAFEGGAAPRVADGDLLVGPRDRPVRFEAPVAHQPGPAGPTPVPVGYDVDGTRVRLDVGPYDPTRRLVIDPVIKTSSYLGGSSWERAKDIVFDDDGNVYVTGMTDSADFPVKDAYQEDNKADWCTAFISKFGPDGRTLRYSTYLGGTVCEYGLSIGVDADGHVVASGLTWSSDFPTVDALDDTFGKGNVDTFVTKLTPDGSDLVYSTYLGGKCDDRGFGVAVQPDGAAVATGWTCSPDFPLKDALFPPASGEWPDDAFISKIRPDGSGFVYSTLLGGSEALGGDGNFSKATRVEVDETGHAYVTGWTESDAFPTTPGVVQPTRAGKIDAFVTKVAPDGSRLAFSTYLGGSLLDWGFVGSDWAEDGGVAVDSDGAVYVAGHTSSDDFPTKNAFQPERNADAGGFYRDAFLAKLTPDGTDLVFSTYFGGSTTDYGTDVEVYRNRTVYLTGHTDSSDLHQLRPIQDGYQGDDDAYVAAFTSSGNLTFSTYLGGSGWDSTHSVDSGPGGHLALAGLTENPDFPTKDAFQSDLAGGGEDAIFAILADTPGPPRNLQIDGDKETGHVDLSWDAPVFNGSSNLTGYRIYRGESPDASSLQAEVGLNTTYAEDVDCSGLPWGTRLYYTVKAVNDAGEGVPATVERRPCSLRHLLWGMNDRFPFYWGNVSLDNSHGGPDTPPDDYDQMDANISEGKRPFWYAVKPARFACCASVVADFDALEPRTADNDHVEIDFEPGTEISRIVPGDIGEDLTDKLQDAGSGVGTYSGHRIQDRPFLDPDLGAPPYPAAVAHADIVVAADAGNFTGKAGGVVEGKFFLHEDLGRLQFSAIDRFFLLAEAPGPNRSWERDIDFAPRVEILGHDLDLSHVIRVEGRLEAGLETDVNAMLGAGFQTGTVTPEFATGGAGLKARGNGSFAGSGHVVGAFDFEEFVAGADATGEIKGEAVVALEGTAPGETLVSPYTQTRYRNLTEGWAGVVYVGPADVDIEPIVVDGTFLGYIDIDGRYEIPDWLLDRLHLDRQAFTFSATNVHVTAGSGVSILDTVSVGASSTALDDNATADPGTHELLIEVQGTPGNRTNVTVARPAGFWQPNGSFVVDRWNVTLPDVEIGPDGTSLLRLDTLDVRRQIQDRTRKLDESRATALDRVNRGLDTNGDGRSDLEAGAVPHEERSIARLNVTLTGPDGRPDVAFVGEPVTLSAAVADVRDPDAVPNGSVAFEMGDRLLADEPLSADGSATAEVAIPANVSTGPALVTARYAGSDSHRAARAAFAVDVRDRAPPVRIRQPGPLHVVNGTNDFAMTVRFEAVDAADVDDATAQVRIDNRSWTSAGPTGDGAFEATLDLGPSGLDLGPGFHHVNVEVRDVAGQAGRDRLAFVVDTDRPRVEVVAGPSVLFEDETLVVDWNASEPVGARLVVEDPAGSERVERSSAFAPDGTLQMAGLSAGTYTYRIEAVDRATQTAATEDRTLVVLPSAPVQSTSSTGHRAPV